MGPVDRARERFRLLPALRVLFQEGAYSKYGQIPCTLLGRLAVDTGYRGLGLGSHLLLDALQRALLQSGEVASWAVIMDAKDEAAERFHSHYGFMPLPKTHRRLFLPMATIAALFR